MTVYGCAPDEAALFRELAPRLGLEPTITASPLSEHTVALASGHRCISVGHKTRVTEPVLDALSRAGVAYISTRSAGYDHIAVEHAHRLGIRVENVAYSPDSVADHTLMLMLMAVRHARPVLRGVDEHDYRLHGMRGRELRDLTVGVVGTGRIGTAVITRLRAFGCRILTYDLRDRNSDARDTLDELLERSDIVTLHIPLTAATHHLLDAERIRRLKRGAFVVNTARGPLVDTEALIAALERGRLGGAALDVVEGEEGVFYVDLRGRMPADTPLARLQALPNVVVTPHVAFHTDHALTDTVANTIINCLRFEGREHR
ncbi:NAD(P)-dependent oxidoreductase [Diaminobutyricimonas aerilata]|nr:NAD(P)-dependent oxidoreductase [Diaminobutyricimonas aerilata]